MKSLILFLALSFSLNAFAVPTSNESVGIPRSAVQNEASQLHRERMEIVQAQAEQIAQLTTLVKVLCFPGDTPISVKDPNAIGYRSIPISSISVGDAVMSCDLELEGGTCEFRPVQQVITNRTDRLINLTIDGRILRATENHPFYVVDRKEWVEARTSASVINS